MANTSFTATPNPVNPTATQGLFPNWVMNAPDSQYAGQYGYDTTIHLRKVVMDKIVDSIPKSFGIFPILFNKQTKYVASDEYTWTEEIHGRPVLYASAGVAGGATQNVILTSGGTSSVAQNDIVVYSDNTHAIITAVNTTTNTITLAPYNGAANLPATTAGDRFIVEAPIIADGMNSFVHYDRLQTISYTNFISRGQRNCRWTTDTAIKVKYSGTTDYYERDLQQKMTLAMQDMLALFLNGQKGEVDVTIPGGAAPYKAKVNDGVFPFMQKNGAMHSVSSPVTAEHDFKKMAFATDYQAEGGTRFILGTAESLDTLSTSFKDPVHFSPNDTISNLGLQKYKIGAMEFVPLVVPQMRASAAMFPAFFENLIIVLDMDKVQPVCLMTQEPLMSDNTSKLYVGNGGYNDYIDYFVRYRMGLEFHTVASSFYMQLINH